MSPSQRIVEWPKWILDGLEEATERQEDSQFVIDSNSFVSCARSLRLARRELAVGKKFVNKRAPKESLNHHPWASLVRDQKVPNLTVVECKFHRLLIRDAMAQQCSTLKGFIDPRCAYAANGWNFSSHRWPRWLLQHMQSTSPRFHYAEKTLKEEKCQRNCLHKWLVHEITLPRFYCASKFFEPLLRLMKRIFHPPILSLRKVLDTPENARASSKHSYFNGFLSKSRQKIFLSPPHPPARPGRRLLMRVSRIA